MGSIPTASTISMTALRGLDQFQDLQGGFGLGSTAGRPHLPGMTRPALDRYAAAGRTRRFRIARVPFARPAKASGQSSGLITCPEAMTRGVAMLRGALQHSFSMVPSISLAGLQWEDR